MGKKEGERQGNKKFTININILRTNLVAAVGLEPTRAWPEAF